MRRWFSVLVVAIVLSLSAVYSDGDLHSIPSTDTPLYDDGGNYTRPSSDQPAYDDGGSYADPKIEACRVGECWL